MRTIKFRRVFKNRSTGEISFAYWGFIDTEDKPVHDFSIFKSPAHNNQCNIISDDQFTGLFDKDGAEIYEGDKVHSKMSRYLGTEKYYIVEWADCKFVAKGYNGSIEVKPILNFRTDWEIIGNIHDKTSDQ